MNVGEAIEHGRQWMVAGWTWAPGQVVLRESTGGRYVVTRSDVGALFEVVLFGVYVVSDQSSMWRDSDGRPLFFQGETLSEALLAARKAAP